MSGDLFGNYRLLRELGRGNNAVVYLARQEMLDKEVACKILFPELAENPDYTENFLREARFAARLDHPNIVQALDAGEIEGSYFFVMEYVDGESLEFWRLQQPEKITVKFLLDIALQLADALDYAWNKHGMIHGDIKPENLLITHDRPAKLKLADLGLARVHGIGEADEVMATPIYVAPEVIADPGAAPDPRSDIYSFGIMLYELSCGRAPFSGSMMLLLEKHMHETPERLIVSNPGMDWELAGYIDSMLAKDKNERPGSWAEIISVLEGIRSRLFPEQRPQLENQAKYEDLLEHKKEYVLPGWVKLLFLAIIVLVIAATLLLLLF